MINPCRPCFETAANLQRNGLRSGKTIAALAFCLLIFGANLFAEEVPWTDKFMREFSEIKTRLEKIQKRQQEISEKQDKIQGELDRLRVWVHKR